jgi:DNA-binding XRE family transcriptional regulator
MENLHDRLKKYRARACITAGQLAGALGVSRISIWRWESAKCEPRRGTQKTQKFLKSFAAMERRSAAAEADYSQRI